MPIAGATPDLKVPLLPTFITCGNLAAGFAALILALQGRFVWAAGLVLFAAALDLLDGAVARRRGVDGEFGRNLDSLADMVSFGVVPAAVLYLALFQNSPVVGAAVCFVYVVCGALRLARFPLVQRSERFVGLPIPPAGVVLVVLSALGPPPVVALASALLVSVLMVSEVPFPKLPEPASPRRSRMPERERPSTE